MPFEELVAAMERADAVVTHAGVGSVLVALRCGKRPVVVPRLRRLGEAVDDHQLAFGRRFAAAGLVTLVQTAPELERALAAVSRPTAGGRADATRLALELRGFIADAVAERRAG